MKGSSERWPKRWLNDDHFLSFWVLTDTSPRRELQNDFLAGKKLFLFHCCCCFFFCCCLFCCFCFCYWFFSITCSFHVHNTKASGTMGDTQKTMTISATSFRECNRFSPSLICLDDRTRYSALDIPKSSSHTWWGSVWVWNPKPQAFSFGDFCGEFKYRTSKGVWMWRVW